MNANDLFNTIMKLDLEPIKAKLMHAASGAGWSRDKANAVEKEYRRFLCLMKMYPDEDTAPLVDVDVFWHYHILDTMKYARDCEAAFGYFLHHYPYVGMRGGADAQFRVDSGERMRTLYEATFGEAYPGAGIRDDGVAAAYCAGPGAKAGGRDLDSAYCAGPGKQADAARLDTAYCAGPGKQADALRLDTAYCAGPGAAATAYCAGPGARRMRIADGAMTWSTAPAHAAA